VRKREKEEKEEKKREGRGIGRVVTTVMVYWWGWHNCDTVEVIGREKRGGR